MQPSNVLSIETLQPKKKGIFHIMDIFLDFYKKRVMPENIHFCS